MRFGTIPLRTFLPSLLPKHLLSLRSKHFSYQIPRLWSNILSRMPPRLYPQT